MDQALFGIALGGAIGIAGVALGQLLEYMREEGVRKRERAIEVAKVLHRSVFIVVDGMHELILRNLEGDASMNTTVSSLIRKAKIEVAEARALVMMFMQKEVDDELCEMISILGSLAGEIAEAVRKNAKGNLLKECGSWEKFCKLLEQVTDRLGKYAGSTSSKRCCCCCD